jgi:hypothetical protein
MAGQPGFFDLSDRYASLDAKKDPLIEITDVKVIFPAEDLPKTMKVKASDKIVDDEGVEWEVKRQMNDPASIVIILQCRTA